MHNRKRNGPRISHKRAFLLFSSLLVVIGSLSACSVVERFTGDGASGPGGAASETEPAGSHQGGDTRVVCKLQDDTLAEISGLAASIRHPGILWAHNDSGDGAKIYAVNNTSCKIEATITLAGVQARDVEAIAMGRDSAGEPVIWVGDIGDNRGTWPSVRLYRIPEPKSLKSQQVAAKSYNVTYADGPRDAEGLLVDPQPGGRIWIVTKRMAAAGGIYALPETFVRQGYGTASRVGESPAMSTDAAFAPAGGSFVIRTYVGAQEFQGTPPGGDSRSINIPLQTQGEAVTYSSAGTGLYAASEGETSLWFVPLD